MDSKLQTSSLLYLKIKAVVNSNCLKQSFKFLKCEYFLVSLVFYDSKWNIFVLWTVDQDRTRYLLVCWDRTWFFWRRDNIRSQCKDASRCKFTVPVENISTWVKKFHCVTGLYECTSWAYRQELGKRTDAGGKYQKESSFRGWTEHKHTETLQQTQSVPPIASYLTANVQ